MEKYVYSFFEGNKDMKELLGGKGANICEMIRLGMPTPIGFTVTTEACNKYYENNSELPSGIEKEILKNLKKLEGYTLKKFNDPKSPLLLSVRSGARASMPGMMDTVLNLGLNDELARLYAQNINNKRFVYDSYRRFIMMYSDVVCGYDKSKFERVLDKYKSDKKYKFDNDLDGDDWFYITEKFKSIYEDESGSKFPQDIETQLINAVTAVFRSWNNDRAIVYRKMHNIPDSWGTAVNVQEMVYGNLNDSSATGVAFSRNPSSGKNEIYGEIMINAQGEDLVSGVRTPQTFDEFKKIMPKQYNEFCRFAHILERHYKDMQDMEFTIEDGKLYMLQTRVGKRTSSASLKIALDLHKEGMINRDEVINRIDDKILENILHDGFSKDELSKYTPIASGLPASPGAGVGLITFNASDAIKKNKEGNPVILVRLETSPEDIEGMISSEAVVTVRGGMTSHAAVVARGMGKCCVCGCENIIVDEKNKVVIIDNKKYTENDYLSVDGNTGNIYKDVIKKENPKLSGEFEEFMKMVNATKKLGIRANAETVEEVKTAINLGAEGIGLCRTEHMFFDNDKLINFRRMIVSSTLEERLDALNKIKKIQIKDFEAILKELNGLPMTVRYLDPPLHEFLPKTDADLKELAKEINIPYKKLKDRVSELKEFNPMMGLRGCRLLIKYPEIIEMQTESLLTAAINLKKKDITSNIEIMIPLVSDVKELIFVKKYINKVADSLFKKNDVKINYSVGTMIELPRACVKADEIAMEADFFSFGTNDLTQMTFGFSRDDSSKYIKTYYDEHLLESDPFATLDTSGVGELIQIAVNKSKCVKRNIKLGICGEHGGDPDSILFCHNTGLNYVSCSPYRVPISALYAAKAKIISKNSL